ncbi:polyphosphate kinase 2 family protein [Synechocystis sp. FACHB-383]|uniref:polyphosphate kinase 2 family protein n=1 Tax=Synechocystis sp. FACHB-383 TaxID=2692864 RepID=UPI001685409D|nr:polyphosphate kinase 2 family protein [Synechocystis sp. FACHB-383]MBD2654958.1 polyphosphate kinase 2 family protein [Synechocystis sp. FACHB-383]
MKNSPLIAPSDTKIKLKEYDPAFTGKYKNKKDAEEKLASDVERLKDFQAKLYAQDTYGVLLVFQAMDAAGKDGTIKHVMSGVNPQGCQVFNFKSPSAEELDHDYLWRCFKCLPERGRIGIFNRSYYEDVIAVRVHPEFLEKQRLPPSSKGKDIWQRRFKEINNFEEYLVDNGIIVIKFFLNVSKEEQKKRFLERIEVPEKNWKLSPNDAKERQYWQDYQLAFEDMLTHTSTEKAPWYVIPADNKWYMRLAVADIICSRLESLDLQYPVVDDRQKAALQEVKSLLEAEKD